MPFERHERVRGDLELRGQHARRELGCRREYALKKPVSLDGDQYNRPSPSAHASNDTRMAADRPEVRSTARLPSPTQPSRPRKKMIT